MRPWLGRAALDEVTDGRSSRIGSHLYEAAYPQRNLVDFAADAAEGDGVLLARLSERGASPAAASSVGPMPPSETPLPAAPKAPSDVRATIPADPPAPEFRTALPPVPERVLLADGHPTTHTSTTIVSCDGFKVLGYVEPQPPPLTAGTSIGGPHDTGELSGAYLCGNVSLWSADLIGWKLGRGVPLRFLCSKFRE